MEFLFVAVEITVQNSLVTKQQTRQFIYGTSLLCRIISDDRDPDLGFSTLDQKVWCCRPMASEGDCHVRICREIYLDGCHGMIDSGMNTKIFPMRNQEHE